MSSERQPSNDPEPWRLRCPQGHANIELTGDGDTIECNTCEEEYREPVDAKTGEPYSESPERTVYVRSGTSGSKRVYHLSPDCQYLRTSKHRVFEKKIKALDDSLTCCTNCDQTKPKGGGDRSIYMAAKRAGEEASS